MFNGFQSREGDASDPRPANNPKPLIFVGFLSREGHASNPRPADAKPLLRPRCRAACKRRRDGCCLLLRAWGGRRGPDPGTPSRPARSTVVIISTHNREMSEEVHSGRYHHDVLNDLAYCPALNRAATVGGNVLKVLDLMGTEVKEIHTDCVEFGGGAVLDRVEWTNDGQVLSVSTQGGEVHTFLASLPVINAAYEQKLVYLTSLLELSVIDVLGHGAL